MSATVEPMLRTRNHRARYDGYRASRVWGLPHLPEHWGEKPLKRLVTINPDKLSDSTDSDWELEYVDIGNVTLVSGIESTEKMRFELAPSRARRLVRHGDTIVSTVRTYLKAVAQISHPPENLVVSTGFAVLRAGAGLDPGYLNRLCQCDGFVERVVAHSTGVSYPAINASDIGNFEVPLPPLDEQRAIAAFLDRETARIDELIAKKERLVDLVGWLRERLITDAVTRGVSGLPTDRDTGVPWFGRVPGSWTVHNLRRCVGQFVDYRGRTPTKTEDGVPLITAGAIKDGRINHALSPEYIAIDDYEEWMCRGKPARGDVVITTEAPLGEVAQVEDVDVAFAQRVILMKVRRDRVEPAFLRYFYLSEGGKAELQSRASGSTASGIRADRLRSSYVLVPPIDEQKRIVTWLDEHLARVSKPVEAVHLAVVRLREYRSALITAAVTGQIDVRQEAR